MEDNVDTADFHDLLMPEVSMNIDDAPIELNENEAEQSIEIPPEEQNGDVTIVDDSDDGKNASKEADFEPPAANQENLNPNQVPDDYTPEEMVVYQKLFAPGQQAVQFLRTHCTACRIHLGSSPNKQDKRYIHPLLKVLICKGCFEFYGSGDFDKDEDGSELYCRWCGQGGKVLCCAQCPYVFCQKCIKVNMGKKALDMVKESDDWLCYVCKPEQIVNMRVTCRALYDFVQQEFRLAAELKQPDRLKVDNSMCCLNKPKTPAPKRKRSNSTDRPYDINDENSVRRKKKPKLNILTHILSGTNENMSPLSNAYTLPMLPRAWQSQDEDEVVCTPDLSLLMDDEEPSVQTPDASPRPSESPQPSSSAVPFLPDPKAPYHDLDLTNSKDSDIQYIGQTKMMTYPPAKGAPIPRVYAKPALGYKLPPRSMVLNTSTNKPLTTNSKHVLPNFVQLQAPAVRFSNTNTPVVRVSHSHNNSVIDTSVPARLAPGLRYEWFEKATQFTAKVNQNLSTRLCSLSKEQTTVTSLEGLAGIHNNLQEILSNSINSLMQIRKTLRSDFIAGLKKLKFCKNPDEVPPAQPADDNDVIIVDAPNNTNNTNNNKSRGYVKVKPVSELCSSVITIPDDVPSENNGPSLENDTNEDALGDVHVEENATSAPENATNGPEELTSSPEKATSSPGNATSSPGKATSSPGKATSSPGKATNSPGKTTNSPGNTTSGAENPTSSTENAISGPENATSGSENPTSGPCNATDESEKTSLQNGEINKEPQSSNYINTNEALSEISEQLNPETLSLIKSALVESKFETILNNNSKIPALNIPAELFKRMLAVRVIVETNFGGATPRTKPRKGYKAMNVVAVDEQDIEQMLSSSIVVNTTKRKAFDDSFSAFVANITQKSQKESRKGDDDGGAKDVDSATTNVIENEESSQDPQTTDSGIDVDGEQSLSNGIVSCQDN